MLILVIRLMKFAQDQGITFFDNGDAYGNGRAETMFGKFLKTTQRDKVEIGGKFGYDFYSDPGEVGSHKERKQNFSPRFVRFALEQSLKRLGVDRIDLYMTHNIKLPQFRDDTRAFITGELIALARIVARTRSGMREKSAPGASPSARPSAGAKRESRP